MAGFRSAGSRKAWPTMVMDSVVWAAARVSMASAFSSGVASGEVIRFLSACSAPGIAEEDGGGERYPAGGVVRRCHPPLAEGGPFGGWRHEALLPARGLDGGAQDGGGIV